MTVRPTPTVVVVGAATRDLVPGTARGWRMGGGVAYSAMVVARLGLPVGALVGADAEVAEAPELDVLREAGVDVEIAPLERGPVFELIESPAGRRLRAAAPSFPVPVEALPEAWRSAPGWLVAPVDGEVGDAWAEVPPPDAIVGVGWQGLLREHRPDGWIAKRAPSTSPIVLRADVIGVSRDDVPATTELAEVTGLLRPGAVLALTHGARGGLIVTVGADGGPERVRSYPAIRSEERDPTGAGDAFLAAFVAGRLEPRLVGGRTSVDWQARLAATVASLAVEGVGLAEVPDREAIRRRLARPPIAGVPVEDDAGVADPGEFPTAT